jgi:hypothetical protein
MLNGPATTVGARGVNAVRAPEVTAERPNCLMSYVVGYEASEVGANW